MWLLNEISRVYRINYKKKKRCRNFVNCDRHYIGRACKKTKIYITTVKTMKSVNIHVTFLCNFHPKRIIYCSTAHKQINARAWNLLHKRTSMFWPSQIFLLCITISFMPVFCPEFLGLENITYRQRLSVLLVNSFETLCI